MSSDRLVSPGAHASSSLPGERPLPRLGSPAVGWRTWLGLAIVTAALASTPTHGQEPSTRPGFDLSSGEIFTTKDRPSCYLTFRRVEYLDFRVYRVKDPVRFFAGLRDPHVLGSEEPVVAQERTWLERVADWKAARRDEVRAFFRRQLSHEYRALRREQREREQVVQRRTVRYTGFAQVPLLNPSQVVATWREILPAVREAEVRRIPLDLHAAGVYVVEAVHAPLRAYTIVVISDVGLVTKASPGELLAFAAHRFSGEPQAGCDVAALSNQQRVASGTTDGEGLFRAPVPRDAADGLVTVARCGDQTVVTDPGAWGLREADQALVGYVFTDRPVYRPGHTVNVKGILRWRTRGRLRAFDRADVEVSITDPNEKVVLRQRRPVDSYGGVNTSIVLGGGAALGTYAVQIASGEATSSGSFEVQEYRKPEFEVSVSTADRFVLQGRRVRATIRARYYFGQPVAGASVKYVVYQGLYYSPLRYDESGESSDYLGYASDQIGEYASRLDANGEATVSVPVPVDENGRDVTIRIDARVQDASGREVTSQTTVYGTVGRFLLVGSLDRYVFAPGGSATLRVRALDYQGRPQAALRVNAALERLRYPAGRYDTPQVTPLETRELMTDAEGRAEWQTTPPVVRGDLRFRVTAPSEGRLVSDEVNAYIPGGAGNTFDDEDRYLELTSDRTAYQPGDVATLFVRGEALSGPVLVTKERESTSWSHVVRLEPSKPLQVPIDDDDTGDVWVNVISLKNNRVLRAERRLAVPARTRRIQLSVEASQKVSRPRDPGEFTIRALDAAGRPVRAQVTVAVVDEAVYGVRPDRTPDPLRVFYRRDYSRVATQFSRSYSFTGYSGTAPLLLAQRHRPFALADFKADRPVRPAVRKEFPDAIFWAADVVTGADGTARVTVAYPDALTTWRVTARAATKDTLVGAALARTTVTKDVIARVIAPRFLTEGDTVRLPFIAHNFLPDARAFEMGVEASGLTPLEAAPLTSVSAEIPSGGEQRSIWPFRADRAGRATLTGRASAGADSDAVQVAVPVLPFGLARDQGMSGSLTKEGEHRVAVAIPAESNPAARTVEVALAPSLAGSLLGALDYLTSYPYGCTEQVLSSFLPNLIVLRTLDELHIAPAERLGALDRLSASGLRRLLDLQHDGGGFGWWKTDQDHPFMTAYALYGLIEADRAGLHVDRERIANAADAAARLYVKYPRAVPELKAYVAWSLALAAARGITVGDVTGWDGGRAREEIWDARSRLGGYGRALLVLLLETTGDRRAAEAARDLVAAATTQGELTWWTSDGDPLLGDYGDTSVEATALAVQALAGREPNNPLLERAIRWLMAARTGTYWISTKQSALALYGLTQFLRARHETPAAFTVDVLVNGEPAGTQAFTPESWTRPDPVVVTAAGRAGQNEVTLVTRGAGALYWSVTARYYDTAQATQPTGSRRLAIAREYFSLSPVQKDGRTVYRAVPFEGTAHPGDVLLVRLTAAGATDWRYLMIEDPIAAGTEALEHPEAFELEDRGGWYWGSHREFRDDRVVLFQQQFDRGRYEYRYLLKVVTPGSFRAMPTRIAPMYVPGTSASARVQPLAVEDPGTVPSGAAAGGAR